MSEATGNYHKLDSVAQNRYLGQMTTHSSTAESVQMAQASSEASPSKTPKILIGDPKSSSKPLSSEGTTIQLSPQDRPNTGAPDSAQRLRHERWRANRKRQGLPTK